MAEIDNPTRIIIGFDGSRFDVSMAEITAVFKITAEHITLLGDWLATPKERRRRTLERRRAAIRAAGHQRRAEARAASWRRGHPSTKGWWK